MERVYAFTDESGAFGWDLDNPTVSTHFIISSIIVKESDLPLLRAEVSKVQNKYFPKGEIKSSKIGKNHVRRKQILADLVRLPFSVFAVVVDKRQLTEAKGLRYKSSFYKFLNNIVHRELRAAFSCLTIIADEIGGSDYMQSFSRYVESKQDIPNMFGEAEFLFQDSQDDVIIQLADLISGTLSFQYDAHKIGSIVPNYIKLLEKKIIRIELYPKTYQTYVLDTSALTDTVLINGTAVTFPAYNIENKYMGSNYYYKLRDFTKALSGSGKQCELQWSDAKGGILLTANLAYTPVGGELTASDVTTKTATPNSVKVYKDIRVFTLDAYSVNGTNYLKLTDLARLFNTEITWGKTTSINTNSGYFGIN